MPNENLPMNTSGNPTATNARQKSLLNGPLTTTKPLLVVLKALPILALLKPVKAFPDKSFHPKTLLNKKSRPRLQPTSSRQIHYGGLSAGRFLAIHRMAGCARLVSAARPFHPHQLLVGDQRCKARIKEQPLLDQSRRIFIPARAQVIDRPIIQPRHQVRARVEILRIQIETGPQKLDTLSKLLRLQQFDAPVVEEFAQQLYCRNPPQTTTPDHCPALPLRRPRLNVNRTS